MFKDDAVLMFESYKLLVVYLKENKDEKGLELFTDVVKNSQTLIFGLVGVINKLALDNDKELFTKAKEEVKK